MKEYVLVVDTTVVGEADTEEEAIQVAVDIMNRDPRFEDCLVIMTRDEFNAVL